MMIPRIYRHENLQSRGTVRTKKLKLSEWSELFFQIAALEDAPIAMIESQIVSLVADIHLRSGRPDVLLSKLLENINRSILAQWAVFTRAELSAFIGITQADQVSFSICADHRVYLSQEDRIINIADGMAVSDGTFSYVSSGVVHPGDALFVSNIDLLSFLTKDDLAEFNADQDPAVIEDLISRETSAEIDCLVFFHPIAESGLGSATLERLSRWGPSFVTDSWSSVQKGWIYTQDAIRRLEIPTRLANLWGNPKVQEVVNKKEVRVGLYATGMVVAVGLLILITRSLFTTGLSSAVPAEYKAKLIEAEQILSKSGRDIANREAFKESLNKAQSLVFEVRDKNIFANDVNALLAQISVLKRQLNGIESYKLSGESVLFWLPKDLKAKNIFEFSKRYFVVTENGVYGPLLKGSEPKLIKYPDDETYKSASMTSEGVLYVLTFSNRILKLVKGEFTYANVEGQANWQKSSLIDSFNGNLYLLSDTGTEVYRHRPSLNGFSSKVAINSPDWLAQNPYLDFTIENGFFAIKSDLTVDKLFTAPAISRQWLVLNKLPDEYRNMSDSQVRIISSPTANFLYLILNGNIWIFEPDSRNFKDIRSIKYIGQIEVEGAAIESVVISKDGEIIVLTPTQVGMIKFEVADSKLRLR
jgi:hypothetical protein